jgi:hypothetical protein
VGPDAARWTTRAAACTVLFVVHNVTSAARLLDVLPLFDDALDVQCVATCTGSSPFLAGVPELPAEAGLPVLPCVVDDATRETDRLALVDLVDLVVERSPAPPGPRATELLRERPHATLAVVVTGRDGCLVRTREGTVLALTARPGPDGSPTRAIPPSTPPPSTPGGRAAVRWTPSPTA